MPFELWAIDGDSGIDVRNAVAGARLVSHAAYEGEEGIIGPLDLRVTQLDVAGTKVRIQLGAGAILNRATGSPNQAYSLELREEPFEVDVEATDSGGGRSDLIVLRVENPFVESWPDPDNPDQSGSYLKVRTVRGVPSNTIDYHALATSAPGTYGDVTIAPTDSVIVLARIDIPVSTGTITQVMIKDLRSVARFGGRRVAEDVVEQNPWTESSYHAVQNDLLSTHTAYQNWPSQASWQVPVPKDATGVDVWLEVDAQLRNGHVWGDMVLQIDGSIAGFNPSEFDANWTGNPHIVTCKIRGTYPITPSVRGRVVTMRTRARMVNAAAVTGLLSAKPATTSGGGTYTNAFFHFKKNPSFI